MSTIEAETPQTTDEQPDAQPVQTNESSAVAELSREELFQWNTWVHVGGGAEQCPLAQAVSSPDYKVGMEIPACPDQAHFHAWIRLPNPLQRRDIVDKATAAQARKARELRDPESDGAVILDNEIDLIRASGDTEQLVQEIVERHFQEDLSEATNEVMDQEDDEATDDEGSEVPLKYQHVDQDMEELRRQEELPGDKRDSGFDRLKAHVESYHEAIDERMKAIQERRAEGLRERGLDHLLSIVRSDRASLITTEEYIHTHNVWQWFTCTYKPKTKGTPNEKVWGDINHMRLDSPPEVIGVLRAKFDDLDRNLINSRRAKNS